MLVVLRAHAAQERDVGMSRPRILDLFSCAGGAGMGYSLAGFDVVGVDMKPQKRYPFMFVQADALEFVNRNGRHFDAVHASPPCQRYANVTAWRGQQGNHPDMVDATRDALVRTGLPYVIENVPEAPLRVDLLLCGSQFGLRVKRHRVFESNVPLMNPGMPCNHDNLLPFMHKGERAYADAMGCTWMSNREGRQAIPPAYTEHIGRQLIEQIGQVAA